LKDEGSGRDMLDIEFGGFQRCGEQNLKDALEKTRR